ncbi:hypothetical protein [Rubrivivax gelatinosus]|uniref:hypothetical protein n=1 Tax=Rubrivivax gelatinosus TaxID=28068 RepID=UPI0012FE67EA|nr:hypothetical protein [Rubrivivax gelatinosus]MBG6083214.1 hypothetical protein [Rubrivivax gelatinosus]
MLTNAKFYLAAADDLVVWRIRGKSGLDYLFLRKDATCFYVVSDRRLTRYTVAPPEGPLTVISELFEAESLERRLLEVETSSRISAAQVLDEWPAWADLELLTNVTTPQEEAQMYERSVATLETLEF